MDRSVKFVQDQPVRRWAHAGVDRAAFRRSCFNCIYLVPGASNCCNAFHQPSANPFEENQCSDWESRHG